MGDQKSKI